MGKKGRDRSQRRHGFDDEEDAPLSPYSGPSRQPFGRASGKEPVPSGPAALGAVVKWFNAEKGFGFIELSDGSGDVFLHVAVLQAAGHETVEPNAKLGVQVGVGQKGRQVTAVLSVEAAVARSGQDGRPLSRASSVRTRPDPAAATSVEGTVKWYNPNKGFGFVSSGDGEKDVFIHASILERAGVRGLEEGRRVSMKVVKTGKGREAISLALLE